MAIQSAAKHEIALAAIDQSWSAETATEVVQRISCASWTTNRANAANYDVDELVSNLVNPTMRQIKF